MPTAGNQKWLRPLSAPAFTVPVPPEVTAPEEVLDFGLDIASTAFGDSVRARMAGAAVRAGPERAASGASTVRRTAGAMVFDAAGVRAAGATAVVAMLTARAGTAAGAASVPTAPRGVTATAVTADTLSMARNRARTVDRARRRRVGISMPGGSARWRTTSTGRSSLPT